MMTCGCGADWGEGGAEAYRSSSTCFPQFGQTTQSASITDPQNLQYFFPVMSGCGDGAEYAFGYGL